MALNSANSDVLVPEVVANILVTPLEAASAFLAAGPRIIDTAGPVKVPTMAAPTTPAWHGQGELITEVDPHFGELSLLPSTMKAVKTLTRFSNELARQSTVNLDQALQARLVTDVAAAMDAQLFSDKGDGIALPTGLFAYKGVNTQAVAGALKLDQLIDAQGTLLGENVNLGATKWVVRPETFTALRKIKDTTGNYVVQPDVTQGAGFQLLGAPVIVSSRVPAGKAALVDFSQIVVARDVAPEVKVLDQTFGNYDQQAIRVVYRMDAAPANPKAIVTLTGITA